MLAHSHAFTALCFGALFAPARRSNLCSQPGSRIGIVAPAGFAAATSFVGFEDKTNSRAIVIADLPRATYDEMMPTFSPEALTKGGIPATQPSASWPVAGGEGRIMRGTQESRGVSYRRWLVLARTSDTGAMVSAMVPEEMADAATPVIEAALNTIAFRPAPSLDERIAALPFRIGDNAGFRPVLATGGLSLLLTEGPSDKASAATQPVVYLIAHGSGAQGGSMANAQIAREMFAKTPTLRSIVSIKEEDRGGTSLIEGTAVEASSMAEVDVVQIVRFENGGYMRSVGIWRRGEAGRYRERLERLIGSVRLR